MQRMNALFSEARTFVLLESTECPLSWICFVWAFFTAKGVNFFSLWLTEILEINYHCFKTFKF